MRLIGGTMMDGGGGAAALRPDGAGYRFGRFVLRGPQRLLLADGEPVELGARAFDVLMVLAGSGGALVTKAAVLDRVWAGLAVEENNLQVQVSTLRRVLGADRDWIVTLPSQGYRFTAPVTLLTDVAAPPAVSVPVPHLPVPHLSILVLPFASRGGDPALDWFADGITDSLTTDLARALPGCTVAAQTTASTYKGRAVDVREIGRAMAVRFVLEGSILQANGRVRVNAQLIEAESGAHAWAERFDKPAGSVMQLQDEIVARLTRTIGVQMIACEARRAERVEHDHPDASTAADFVLRGHAASMQRMSNRVRFDAATGFYGRALHLDPLNVDALAGMASVRVYQVVNCYLDCGGWDGRAREAHLAEADGMLARVLAADPGHPSALRTRAVLLRARGAFADALAAAGTLLAEHAGDPAGYRETGLNLLYLGRTEEAVDWFRRADALMPADPLRWTWLQGLGRALIQLGRDAEAVEALRLAIESNPDHAPSYAYLAAALALSGDGGRARLELAEFRVAEPGTTLDVFARRSPVPLHATAPEYRSRNGRLLDGLRQAGLA